MHNEKAECGALSPYLKKIGEYLDDYLLFKHPDAMNHALSWQRVLGGELPETGLGIDALLKDMGQYLIPNGSQIPKPGCTSFITTGASTIGVLASLSGSVAAPQRLGLTAFNYLEALSLEWMAELFELPQGMQGVYTSGGSTANLIALGAARQAAFEAIGIDVAEDGVQKTCRIYCSAAAHRTIHRAAAALGLGRSSVVDIPVDEQGCLCPIALEQQLEVDSNKNFVAIAIVANAGTTDSGSIDPLRVIGELAHQFGIWYHIDGAYGLPGILDPSVRPLFDGLVLADSVIVDPHKWLGAPIGIGAAYVRNRSLLERAFSQGSAHYLEGSFTEIKANDDYYNHDKTTSSMDSMGTPYSDYGLELSAPSRGAVVWAIIREIGKEGLTERVCRHNAMARKVADLANNHPNLEVAQKPTLSICCFRYVSDNGFDLNELNRQIHRQMVLNGRNIPSTTLINGKLVIRPCFVGARTSWKQAQTLVDEVIELGDLITSK